MAGDVNCVQNATWPDIALCLKYCLIQNVEFKLGDTQLKPPVPYYDHCSSADGFKSDQDETPAILNTANPTDQSSLTMVVMKHISK